MQLKDILDAKGRTVYTISPDATLADVVEKLVHHNCGSLVVCEQGEVVGIITERDILRTCAAVKLPLDQLPVRARMETNLITGSPEDEVQHVMGVLTKRRIRHLPILEHGQLAGMISIGDVVKAQHDQLSVENDCLMRYIQG